MEAESAGKQAKETFIKDRLEKNDHFFEPIKRMKLKTFADVSKKVKVTMASNRTIEYKQQGNIAFQLLVSSYNQDNKVDLREMMRYPLMPVPSSIGTADGYLMRTDKSKGLHHILKGVANATLPECQSISRLR